MTPEELLAKATAELASAGEAIANHAKVVDEMTAKISALEQSLASEAKAKEEIAIKASSLEAAFASAQTKISSMEQEATKVEVKAAKIAASCGVAPVASTPADAKIKSRDEAVAEMSRIQDPIAKQEFFKANMKTLLGL